MSIWVWVQMLAINLFLNIMHTHHTSSGLFSNKGIPEDLRQSAHTKWNMVAVPSQWTNTLLQETNVISDTKSCFHRSMQKHRTVLGSVEKPSFTFRASRLRLISAVSIKVVRSLLLTSVPRSFPAKSTNENFPCSVDMRLLRRKEIWRTACERDELEFAEVWPEVLGWWRKKWCCRG